MTEGRYILDGKDDRLGAGRAYHPPESQSHSPEVSSYIIDAERRLIELRRRPMFALTDDEREERSVLTKLIYKLGRLNSLPK